MEIKGKFRPYFEGFSTEQKQEEIISAIENQNVILEAILTALGGSLPSSSQYPSVSPSPSSSKSPSSSASPSYSSSPSPSGSASASSSASSSLSSSPSPSESNEYSIIDEVNNYITDELGNYLAYQ